MKAADLLATPEMQLRYVAEREVRREGFDEGQGHGFDNLDRSALAMRTVASADAAFVVVDWFVDRLTDLGWTDRGDGWLRRAGEEWILVSVERDGGVSLVPVMIPNTQFSALQDMFERACYSGTPEDTAVVTIFYGVRSRPARA